jgi:F-type H+-transporting ATPase subunit b
MQQLISQLGIDWHLLISQAVNFALLLAALWVFAYKPLLKILHDRRARIEEGLTKADEADRRLHEVDEIGKKKIKAAEAEAIAIMQKRERELKEVEARMLADAQAKEDEALKSGAARLRAQEEESRRAAEREAGIFIRKAIEKTVELSPKQIDDALIARAVKEASRT